MYLKKFLIVLILIIIFLTGCVKSYDVSIKVIPQNAGQIQGEGTYDLGEKVNLHAISNKKYNFIGWEKDGDFIKKTKKYNLEIKENIDLIAKFEKKKYNLKIVNNNKNMGKVSGEGKYLINEKVRLLANPKVNYEFIGWFNTKDKLISDQETYEFLIKSNIKYIAKFGKKKFSIKLDKNIDKAEVFGEGQYQKGEKKFIRAKNISGYEFKYWIDKNDNIFSKKDAKMINIKKDLDLKAIYKKKEKPFYLGVSQKEILKILKKAYSTYFYINDHRYTKIYNYNTSDRLSNSLSQGDYYISLKPLPNDVNIVKHKDFIKDIKINKVSVDNNEIIVNSTLKILKIIKKFLKMKCLLVILRKN